MLGLGIRWQGHTSDGHRAAHVGNDHMYLALIEAAKPGEAPPDYGAVGLNHFGLLVESLDAIRPRLKEVGVEPHLEGDYEPGLRLYFYDPDGMEVELVQYANVGAP